MKTGAKAHASAFPSTSKIPYDRSTLGNVNAGARRLALPGVCSREPFARRSAATFATFDFILGAIMALLFVNNQRYTVDLPGDTPLLWILRDHLQLVGTKYGCGVALCGACTVLIDGVATRSCTLPISAMKPGVEVTTIEGLKTKEGKAVQAAWEKLDVPQCGYCQSGQVMSASALLAKIRKPSDADIDASMAGNVCRCATYVRIRAAIHEAAKTLA
jgi:isoquinoline 1-oxidoreductase subunit alpha